MADAMWTEEGYLRRKCHNCEKWHERADVLEAYNMDTASETYHWCPWCQRSYYDSEGEQ